ncbi:MAG: hypothetical protein JST80_11925 [Bdellovibrionales bacterium]|nr:hypothetical protein [Bdellovibrionales bacterium]
MRSLLALLALASILYGNPSPAAADHYSCTRSGKTDAAPAKIDLRRWSELLRIKLAPQGKIEFAGTYDSTYRPETTEDAGTFRFKDFTSQNAAYRAIILSPAIYAGRSSGKVRLEIPSIGQSKRVTYDCSQVK